MNEVNPFRWAVNVVKRYRSRRDCFHHDTRNRPDSSWIVSDGFLDYRKTFHCEGCGKVWII